MCLAQGHNTMTPVQPFDPRSNALASEPLPSTWCRWTAYVRCIDIGWATITAMVFSWALHTMYNLWPICSINFFSILAFKKSIRYSWIVITKMPESSLPSNEGETPRIRPASYCLWPCSLTITSTGYVGLWLCGFYVQEHLKAQPAVVLILKRLRRRDHDSKSHPTDWESRDSWIQGKWLIFFFIIVVLL